MRPASLFLPSGRTESLRQNERMNQPTNKQINKQTHPDPRLVPPAEGKQSSCNCILYLYIDLYTQTNKVYGSMSQERTATTWIHRFNSAPPTPSLNEQIPLEVGRACVCPILRGQNGWRGEEAERRAGGHHVNMYFNCWLLFFSCFCVCPPPPVDEGDVAFGLVLQQLRRGWLHLLLLHLPQRGNSHPNPCSGAFCLREQRRHNFWEN